MESAKVHVDKSSHDGLSFLSEVYRYDSQESVTNLKKPDKESWRDLWRIRRVMESAFNARADDRRGGFSKCGDQ